MDRQRHGRPPHRVNPDASAIARLGAELRERRQSEGLTQAELAALIGFSIQHISEVELAKAPSSSAFIAECDRALKAQGALLELWSAAVHAQALRRGDRRTARRRQTPPAAAVFHGHDAELEAIELASRVRAGDVSAVTLEGLELTVHDLCRRYTSVPPAELLDDVRHQRRAIFDLLDVRATLRQRRQLMVSAGWLSLLCACLYVDVGQHAAALPCRRAAHDLGVDTGDRQMVAWTLEIRAWQALLARRYEDAIKLCRAGRDFAGRDTSAAVQLTAQEARACARLGNARETYAALDDAAAMCSRLPASEHPDHHFTFDPAKLTLYMSTTLAWLGDGERAEPFARDVIDTSQRTNRPGRLAMGRVDLALVLAQQDHAEEACDLGHLAISSGWLAPANIWRVAELDRELRRYDAAAIAEFHDHYITARNHILADRGARRTP